MKNDCILWCILLQFTRTWKEFFESIEDLKKLDFIDSEVFTPSSKAGKSFYVKGAQGSL
jgi:hypothetical protein